MTRVSEVLDGIPHRNKQRGATRTAEEAVGGGEG
jgi:hypothetical protein